jgi:predicted aspartyl protease
MKKHLLLFALLFVIAGCAVKKGSPAASLAYFNHADSLLTDKDYFGTRQYIALHKKQFSEFHRLILEAGIDNAFNKPVASNEKIGLLFKDYGPQLKDSIKLSLLVIRQYNHARLFEYADANAAINNLLNNYSALLSEEDISDYRNMGIIWSALSGQPPQEVIVSETTSLKMTRDKANLANLQVKSGVDSIDFIFDTGANLSTVTQSTATRLNMKLLESEPIEVGAITGATVMAQLAVCPQFTLGGITVKNAVFLVFPDTALAFSQIGYQINGIIGFPVIEAMKEVQITRSDEFIVPEKPSACALQNMALDFLKPVIAINEEYYTFDTGATGTSLYKKYYDKHKADIIGNYKETNLQFGGAGGMLTKKGYLVTFSPKVAAKILNIESVQAFSESIDEEQNHFYGNIGQDVIREFQKMTLNFESMFINFEQ